MIHGAMMSNRSSLIERLSRSLGNTLVPIAGKRPQLFDRVLRSALEKMGFNNPDDRLPDIREKLASKMLDELGPLLTIREINKLRVHVHYGLAPERAAELFSVPVDYVHQVMKDEALVLPSPPKPARASRKKRAS